MDRRAMVVSGEPVSVTRNGRRYFSKAHREAVVARCLAPGASLAAVALANGLNANLVRKWVRQRQGRSAAGAAAKLLPVTVRTEPTRAVPEGTMARRTRGRDRYAECGSMHISLGAIELMLLGRVDREQLALVLDLLLRSR